MKEKRINYLQILYYTVAGVVVGILVGAIDAVFGRVLLAITDFRGQHVMVLVPFLGAAGVLILFLYQKFSPKAQKGMGLIFDTGFEENEKIPPALVPLIMVSTWLTHLFGGSAGREGVAGPATASMARGTDWCDAVSCSWQMSGENTFGKNGQRASWQNFSDHRYGGRFWRPVSDPAGSYVFFAGGTGGGRFVL